MKHDVDLSLNMANIFEKQKDLCRLTWVHTFCKCLNPLPYSPDLRKKPLENIVRKGENAGNQHFLPFPQCFLPFPTQIFNFAITCTFILWSANAINLDQSKILSFGEELNPFFYRVGSFLFQHVSFLFHRILAEYQFLVTQTMRGIFYITMIMELGHCSLLTTLM